MKKYHQFYLNGQWVTPSSQRVCDVVNPASEQVCGQIILGDSNDVENAVQAASQAFLDYSQTSTQKRKQLLGSIIEEYKRRYQDLVDAVIEEMGAPVALASKAQVGSGLGHLKTAFSLLDSFSFQQRCGSSLIQKEPIGVCALITPWNWPLNQIACKVAPALATGCTMVLKPSEIAPFSANVFADILHQAGVPKGVFNLIQGDGAVVGSALSAHPLVDMVSFTGSTRAGVLVAQNAAPSVKRVTQELGGKSPNIIMPDADFEAAVKSGVRAVFTNTGQSCNAPTRMLVPQNRMIEAEAIARETAQGLRVGEPKSAETQMGPLVSQAQWQKVQDLIRQGLEEGAKLVCGGLGKPEGLVKGFYVKPTVFSEVSNQMTIAREEIFGPVLSIIPYADLEQAITIANDTPYGLAAYLQGSDAQQLRQVANRLRAGNVNINGSSGDLNTPFGGYKQSGNGREWGAYGFEDYLEIKAISGLAD